MRSMNCPASIIDNWLSAAGLGPGAVSDIALVGMGANLPSFAGSPACTLRAAKSRLQEFSDHPVLMSDEFATAPVDCPADSPAFVNAVLVLVPRHGQSPEMLLSALLAIEDSFGRRRTGVINAARPLDLDLLAFRDCQTSSAFLTLPHPRAISRRFVLEPLVQLWPDYIFPGQTQTAKKLLQSLIGA
jgi:2-amino-4-hydroxy-6-hydroxymethyldihydropteridine diphosphokinase